MYICICKGITDKDLLNAAATSSSTSEIMRKLGVASDCGQCVYDAVRLLNEHKNNAVELTKNDARFPSKPD